MFVVINYITFSSVPFRFNMEESPQILKPGVQPDTAGHIHGSLQQPVQEAGEGTGEGGWQGSV